MEDFKTKLNHQIKSVNESVEHPGRLSFTNFLSMLNFQSFQEYNTLVSDLLNSEKSTQENWGKAVLLYSNIITKVEKREENTILIDTEGKWLFSMFSFINLEMQFRNGLYIEYNGFLYDGYIKCPSNPFLESMMNSHSKN